MQLYNFEIKYIPDKEVALADAVSRVNPQKEIEQRDLISLYKVAQCMTNADGNDKW